MSETVPVELSGIHPGSMVAEGIWGPTMNEEAKLERNKRLKSFFVFYQSELGFENLEHNEVLSTIRILKRFPEARKLDLRHESDAATTANHSVQGDLVDLTLRSMFLTACTPRVRPGAQDLSGGTVSSGGTVFRPYWKSSESLEGYLARVFPKSQPPQQDLLSFNANKLKASYLQTYANIQIKWTNYLSDHLILLKGENWKTLYIFRHPGFIKVSLGTLATNEAESTQTLVGAIKLGCLPPALLKETLLTMNLIFPIVGDQASRTILEREVRNHGLDPYLLRHFYLDDSDHECPGDAIEPRDIKTLYKKYPYWADRLYDIWSEADDPTPITRIERWTEARRNPRFTYWCTVVSIMLAITFGMLSIGLAAAQLWIAWCDWVDDPTRAQCGYKRPSADPSGTD